MPYAVGYARFSSVKQSSGSSLERQQAMIGKWIGDNPKYKIFPKNFEDLGRSASKGDLMTKHQTMSPSDIAKLADVGVATVYRIKKGA